jgi:hypothetical protein
LRSSQSRSSAVGSSRDLPFSASCHLRRHNPTPQLQDEVSAVVAPPREDVDPAMVSCELRTPPPRPIQWAVDSPKTHTVDLTVDAGPPSSPPGVTHQAVDNDSAKRRLDSFINNVTRKRDSPLIPEPPKQPPAKPVLTCGAGGWRLRPLPSASFQAR